MIRCRIRLADWRDRSVVQPLRALLLGPYRLDGGLYEFLTWPTFHVLLAEGEDGRGLGIAAATLLPNGHAEDVGVAVLAELRRAKLGTRLRAALARDLAILGIRQWHADEPEREGPAWAFQVATLGAPTRHFLSPDGTRYGAWCRAVVEVADALGAGTLTTFSRERLESKARQAAVKHTNLAAVQAFCVAKAAAGG